jgi:hypothetical protein
VAAACAHRITVDAGRANFATTSALTRFVDPHDQRTRDREGDHEQAKQDAASAQTRPPGSIEHALIGLEGRLLRQPKGAPGRRDHATPRSAKRSNHQDRHMTPGPPGEQRGKLAQAGDNVGR